MAGCGDEGFAKGWDILKWKWVREPAVGLVAAFYGALAIVFALLLAVGLSGVVQFLAPIWVQSSPLHTADVVSLRDRLIVIGALVTSPFLVWRLVVSHWAARAAQEQARIAQETSRNTLFTKAIEQLGSTREQKRTVPTEEVNGVAIGFHDETHTVPNLEVRLGAIYALEKIARDDLEMHWSIMETLCAYIRENAGQQSPPPGDVVAIYAKGYLGRRPFLPNPESLGAL